MRSSPLRERITSVESQRRWTDKIPLLYKYTAGVAGEKFLRGLAEEKILASVCSNCDTAYLPPKMYCTNCFREITDYRDVGLRGRVAALTEAYVNPDGSRAKGARLLGYVEFRRVKGGLIVPVKGQGIKVGSGVRARFRPKNKRTGALTDIDAFVLT